MSLLELFVIAVGLAMDAFAVAVCKGLAMPKVEVRKAAVIALYFGAFQAGMPLIGYSLGVQFQDKITSFDHWIAFGVLGLIGVNMIREAFNESCEDECDLEGADASLDVKSMLLLATATSIDALAVGVTFAFLQVAIVPAVSFIGLVTFCISLVGVIIGNLFGAVYKAKAEIAGGAMLILIGTKILLEHLGIWV